MKHLLFIICLSAHFYAGARKNDAPVFQTEHVGKQAVKPVTKAAFLKELTAIHQNARDMILVVTFIPKEKAQVNITYNGTNDKDITAGLALMEAGDRITIASQQQSEFQSTTYQLQ